MLELLLLLKEISTMTCPPTTIKRAGEEILLYKSTTFFLLLFPFPSLLEMTMYRQRKTKAKSTTSGLEKLKFIWSPNGK